MRKNDLIKMLQDIKGNPIVVEPYCNGYWDCESIVDELTLKRDPHGDKDQYVDWYTYPNRQGQLQKKIRAIIIKEAS